MVTRLRETVAERLTPGSTWRSLVLSEIDRLEDDWERAAAWLDSKHGVADPGTERATKWGQSELANYELVDRELARGRAATIRPGMFSRIWRWGSGSDMELAWRSLHAADQTLLLIQDDETVKARLPEIEAAVEANLPAGDARIDRYVAALTKGPLTRAQLRIIKQAADAASDASHDNVRNYRNWLLIAGSVLTVVLFALAVIHNLNPDFLKICQAPQVSTPAGTAAAKSISSQCSAQGANVFEMELAGVLGGIVAAVWALTRMTSFTGVLALPLWQALLRIPTGAATALLGVLVLQSGLLSALVPQTEDKLVAYAAVFGYAPAYLLRMLDQKVNDVAESAATKNDPVRTGTQQS